MHSLLRALAGLVAAAGFPALAAAQGFETLGTRAAGMGSAFVAVADDASAVYWNPAGLASGAYFSLVIDRSTAEAKLDHPSMGSSRSAFAIALSAPPLGLSYYRLRQTTTSPVIGFDTGQTGVASLITHHAGVTLLHSLSSALVVGGTLKVVRGVAASGIAVGATRDELLEADDLIGRASNRVDADLGVMASLGVLRAGLTVRNVSEPEFQSAGSGGPLKLNRQARAGIAVVVLPNWLVALDADLTKQPDPNGDTRNVATGIEGRVHRRVTVRGGFRVNTVEGSGGRPVVSGGGSFAVFGSTFVDAHVTGGSRDGDRGWGLSGRVLF